MARYIGPKSRIDRKFGEAIFGPDKVLSKRNFPPGQHGRDRRRKTSEYGVMLAEKQKAKYTYGVLEYSSIDFQPYQHQNHHISQLTIVCNIHISPLNPLNLCLNRYFFQSNPGDFLQHSTGLA